MLVQGSECSLVIKTSHIEKDIPYSNETLREAVTILEEEASIEGDGACKGIGKKSGVVGCVVTPLTVGTAPLLLYLAMGSSGSPVYVSETRSLYQYRLNLAPMEDTEPFDVIQERGTNNNEQLTINKERKFYERCRVKNFELRILRGEAIKLKLDITSDCPPVIYPYMDSFERDSGERFKGDNVVYKINGREFQNIYGLTVVSKKEGGAKTEVWINRTLENGLELPVFVDELSITAQLLRDKYEYRYFGTLRIMLKRLVLVSDETEINSAGAVMGQVRYFVSGTVKADVFMTTGDFIP